MGVTHPVKVDNYDQANSALDSLIPFIHSTMSAEWDELGRYIVYSYKTPILIIDTTHNQVWENTSKYGATSSKHMNYARTALWAATGLGSTIHKFNHDTGGQAAWLDFLDRQQQIG